MKNAKRLTDRQKRFVHEYLVDQNASAAAERAGYSARNKGTHAAQMMKNPAIRQAIALGLGELFARIDLNALEVLKRQVQQAYLDPAKLFDAGQRAIPLSELDEDTRGGLTVTYALRERGGQVMTVKQTPRHVALNVLQKRLESFEKLQAEVFAAGDDEEEEEKPVAARGGGARGIFDVALKLEEPQEVALRQAPEQVPLDHLQAADAALADAARKLDEVPAAEPPGNPIPTLSLPLKGREPCAEVAVKAVAASASSPTGEAPKEIPSGDAPPPSPFEPGYDFRKDPNAMYGGRFTAWNKYWREKREQELMKAEEQAALLNPPPNFRVGPGKTVPVRMEPGYNPPWLRPEGSPLGGRNNRQEYAIGAGECWID